MPFLYAFLPKCFFKRNTAFCIFLRKIEIFAQKIVIMLTIFHIKYVKIIDILDI